MVVDLAECNDSNESLLVANGISFGSASSVTLWLSDVVDMMDLYDDSQRMISGCNDMRLRWNLTVVM